MWGGETQQGLPQFMGFTPELRIPLLISGRVILLFAEIGPGFWALQVSLTLFSGTGAGGGR